MEQILGQPGLNSPNKGKKKGEGRKGRKKKSISYFYSGLKTPKKVNMIITKAYISAEEITQWLRILTFSRGLGINF